MARNRITEEDRVKTWQDRLHSAGKLYKSWSEEFDTDRLEKYYKGKQWRGLSEEEASKRYVINLVYSTIEVNKPSLIFHRPQIRVQPRPGRANTFGSTVMERARVVQDTVQTFIDDPDVDFALETSLALQEAHFRFGVIEVGYTADYVDNPNAGKPVLKEDKETPVRDSQGNTVMEPSVVPRREDLYVKRIPSSSFRVSLSSTNSLSRNDWVAYCEWHYLEDLKRNPVYKTTGLKSSGVIREELREIIEDEEDLDARQGMVKIWKIWDIRSGKRHVIADGHKKFLLEDEPFSFLPFAIMKFHEILDSFYPLPPVYQWMDPQDEINETREMQRAHRRRFYRRYTMMKGAMDEPELQKLETGGDGVVAESNVPNPLLPVPDAPLAADNWRHLDESKSDFLAVSGIGGDQRGVAESETATQASIIDVRARLRETSARTRVGEWLASIARLMMMTIRERMSLPFWIQRNLDPFSAADPSAIAMEWQKITSDDLGDIDIDIFVELSSMSPVTEEMERNSWNQVLALLTNPQLIMIMAMSEPVLRKTLALYGVKSENEIREVQRVAQQIIQMQMQQAQAQQQQEAMDEAQRAGVAPELIEQARHPNNSAVAPQVGNMMDQIQQAGRGPEGVQ